MLFKPVVEPERVIIPLCRILSLRIAQIGHNGQLFVRHNQIANLILFRVLVRRNFVQPILVTAPAVRVLLVRCKVFRLGQHGIVALPGLGCVGLGLALVGLNLLVLRPFVLQRLALVVLPARIVGRLLLLLIVGECVLIGLICIVHGLFARVVLPGHVLAGAVDVRPVRIELGAILLLVIRERFLRQRTRTRRKAETVL